MAATKSKMRSVGELVHEMGDRLYFEIGNVPKAIPGKRRVCIYGSHRNGKNPKHLEAATEVGRLMAERGYACINGGGNSGCMGAINAALIKAKPDVKNLIKSNFSISISNARSNGSR